MQNLVCVANQWTRLPLVIGITYTLQNLGADYSFLCESAGEPEDKAASFILTSLGSAYVKVTNPIWVFPSVDSNFVFSEIT